MKASWVQCSLLVLGASAMMGCGCPTHVAGGTSGTLLADSILLSDIQVTVHRIEGKVPQVVGFGVTRTDGRFELTQPDAKGPLHLAPGEYHVTVESVGPVPVQFPKEYGVADKTPLRFTWEVGDLELDLEVPLPVASR